MTLPQGASLLTEQELRWFGGSCFNVLPAQGPNLFLSVSFDRAADMDLTALFTGGAGSRDLSDRELRQLGTEGYARLTASELEDLLLRYTGLSLADMSDAAFDGLTYLADFDAYYGPAGDAGYVRFQYGYHSPDGTVTLRYAGGSVTLHQDAGRWLVVSNVLD